MRAAKAIEFLQQNDSYDLQSEVHGWLRASGLIGLDAWTLSERMTPRVKAFGETLLRTVYDAAQIDGLTVDQIREGLDFARERGWDG